MLCLCIGWACGCRVYHNLPSTIGQNTTAVESILCEVQARGTVSSSDAVTEPTPLTLRSAEQIEAAPLREISLQETLSVALQNRTVLRDLGASVLRAPAQVQTQFTESLQHVDPQESVESA